MAALEQSVRDVLKNKLAKPHEKTAAIAAGIKLLAIRHQLKDDKGFFG